MKAVILAGGLGTRLAEETTTRPKPMVEIGGMPILWHVMHCYATHGITDFIVCCGYKGYMIKEYFANYARHNSDFTVDLATGEVDVHRSAREPWRVTCVDTGEATLTGGRLARVAKYLDDGPFCFTYGDGVGDIDVAGSIKFHQENGRACTVTVARPPGRFGTLLLEDDRVAAFAEKPVGGDGYVNAGFFVLDRAVVDLIDGDESIWEQGPMMQLVDDGQMDAWRHDGFWQPMDTLRDKTHLDRLWAAGDAPWYRT